MDKMLDEEVDRIFEDAFSMQRQAIERFTAEDIRDAAEKAWCATRRATDGMILAVTNVEPRSSGKTMEALRRLRGYSQDFKPLHESYGFHQSSLHGNCFYDGHCDPPEVIHSEIQDTLEYINRAKALARRYASGIALSGWNT